LLSSANGIGFPGSRKHNVAANATTIKAGEPVQVNALSDAVVIPMATNGPDQTAHLLVGIAQTESTNTAAAAGTVEVVPVNEQDVWLMKPNAAATWDYCCA